jgi:nuclear pore complex protein Nup133
VVYPLDRNPHASKIAEYIKKFRDEFTDELYQWYIEHGISLGFMLLCFNDPLSVAGELRTLFSQSEVYGDYLDKFFLKHDRPFVSWIQDLDKDRFHSAAETLLAESENSGDLAAKEVMAVTYTYRGELTLDRS